MLGLEVSFQVVECTFLMVKPCQTHMILKLYGTIESTCIILFQNSLLSVVLAAAAKCPSSTPLTCQLQKIETSGESVGASHVQCQ